MSTKTTLEVGDVLYRSGLHNGVTGKITIGRVTKTVAFAKDNESIRFKRDILPWIKQISSDTWSMIRYQLETPKLKEEYESFVMNHTVRNTDWAKVSPEKIKQIYEIICAKEL